MINELSFDFNLTPSLKLGYFYNYIPLQLDIFVNFQDKIMFKSYTFTQETTFQDLQKLLEEFRFFSFCFLVKCKKLIPRYTPCMKLVVRVLFD